MPVNVSIKSNNLDFLKKVGVAEHLIQQLKFDGAKVKFSGINTILFTLSNGVVLGKTVLPVKVETALKGVAGGMDVAPLLTKTIQGDVLPSLELLKKGEISEEELIKAYASDEAKIKAPIFVPKVKADVPHAPSAQGQAGLPVSTLKAAAPVNLRDATHMYQRVKGSTSDNYFVVAMTKEVKIAVKISGNSISMRAEGVISPATAHALAKAKLQMKDSAGKTYMSTHLTCDDLATPAAAIGALLAATELEFETEFPKIAKLKALAV